jgi:opacity protein-like surface antigen
MKKLLAVAVVSLPVVIGSAQAADLPRRPAPQQVWSWTGLYLGAHIGAGWGQSDFTRGTRTPLYGNDVRTPAARGGGQIGYNWQMPGSSWLLGVEAELSALGADGSNTCFAYAGLFVSSNCRVQQETMASITGRIGYAMGPGGRTLVYAKGGGAWLREQISLSTPNDWYSPNESLSTRHDRFGWVVGAGIEQAIAPAWSLKLEYDYADFGRMDITAPASSVLVDTPSLVPPYMPWPAAPAQVSQTMQSIKLGLNLKLGADAGARWDAVPASPLGVPVKAMAASLPVGTEIEIGGRVWYSFGRFQKDLSASLSPVVQDPLVSRLTYTSETASGEVFGRIDTASNIVIKGFVGGGALSRGKMRDEDWLIQGGWVPYSNTLSDPVHGSITYVTGDLGYDIIRDSATKFSAFIGYNYLRDDKTAMGCVQLAGDNPNNPCTRPIPNTVPGISEKNDWHSLRIGINGVMALTDRLQLTADAAYLPYVRFVGLDNHMQRREPVKVSPESGTGQGVQLEAILSYRITPSFSVGAGGRYWAMWATGTDAQANYLSSGRYSALPVRNERFGGFLQASYTFDSAK